MSHLRTLFFKKFTSSPEQQREIKMEERPATDRLQRAYQGASHDEIRPGLPSPHLI